MLNVWISDSDSDLGIASLFFMFLFGVVFFLYACGFMFGCGIRMEDWGVIISQLP